jgi:hypothetical protein
MKRPFRLLTAISFGCFLACSSAPPNNPHKTGSAAAARPPASVTPPPAPPPPRRAPPDAARTFASAAPAYDLDADIAARSAEARADLGARADVAIVEGNFVVAAPSSGGALAGAIDVTRRALSAYFNGRFSKRPERAISVYLFPDSRRYGAYCKKRWSEDCGTPYGFYLGSERRIVMNVEPGIGTLTHELVHPLVEADFPAAPTWINEGIASLFERFYFPKAGEIRGGKNWRHPRLVRALQSKAEREHASLPTLFGLSDAVFRGEREDLNYATARYFCQWLDEQDLLWPFYQRWRDNHAADPSGLSAFQAVVGKTPEQADAEWSRWVRRL